MKAFIKWALSIIATTAIVSGIVYAAGPLINSVAPNQTISSGSVMGENWFQEINDKLIATANLWTKPSNTLISNNDVLVNGSIMISKGGKAMSFDPTIWITFPDGTVQTTAATSGGGGGCWIITPANKVSCYAGHGVKLPVGVGIGAMQWDPMLLNLPVCGSCRTGTKSNMALELRNISGQLWVYGINFPNPYSGGDQGNLWSNNWTTNPALQLCDITSWSCTSPHWDMFVFSQNGFSIPTATNYVYVNSGFDY
jgi:hypothetical protein